MTQRVEHDMMLRPREPGSSDNDNLKPRKTWAALDHWLWIFASSCIIIVSVGLGLMLLDYHAERSEFRDGSFAIEQCKRLKGSATLKLSGARLVFDRCHVPFDPRAD